ncbi:helix-turn-helix domain-containing protein [Chryseobacterium sp. G0201]|uniref:helix-turn-helix domain-containing protein n=1 Tax=Chryseobacterium sp. G0201 TaxID=2487065 RepID=UPI000F4F9B4A|nr:helix-turn-helix domain-containing protein [Chryseobacterium sp. G0201]AZA52120.1 AraC family transcriptional regulator [Chryseobacterium sp. G0201]
MAYIEEIITYIKENVGHISIGEVDVLRKPYKISISKFKRDFKRNTEFTPRDYLIRMKIELARNYKLDDPTLTIKEVVSKIGWDLTERQFAEQFKVHYEMTFGGKPIVMRNIPKWQNQEEEIFHEHEFMFSRDRNDLEEIIFRIVLLTGAYTVTNDHPLSKIVKYEMENTCFRLPMFAFEKEVIFKVFFDRNNYERLDLFALFTRVDEEDYCFVPNDKDAYLNLIYNVAIKQDTAIKKKILDCISNWEEMAAEQDRFEFLEYKQQTYNKNIRPRINRDAGIFEESQRLYDSITKEFKAEYENLLQGMCLREAELSNYLRAVEKENEHMIKLTLEFLLGIGDLLPQKLDLLLSLAEYPSMEFVEFEDYSFSMDKTLISKVILEYPRESMPQLICDYYCAYKDIVERDEEDSDEYLGNIILSDILDDFIKV